MQRFVDNDAGYIAWLREHPAGFVLNTYPHVTSSYLILHRASCRTINRSLGPGRLWTHLYGKACSDERRELESWATQRTGAHARPCGGCLRGEGAPGRAYSARPPSVRDHGPRAPQGGVQQVSFEGAPVRIVVRSPAHGAGQGAPAFVIEGAQWLAEAFFRNDPSAVGPDSYDGWIDATQSDPDRLSRIVDGDVTAVNRTMAARTPHETWQPVIEASDWSWLSAIDPSWDLLEMTPNAWEEWAVPDLLRSAFAAIHRRGLGLAVITKVLHIKRPRLIPVVDSLVADQVGARVGSDIGLWVAAVERVREVGQANLDELRRIREHLRQQDIPNRTLVRILDALLWTSHPGSSLYPRLPGWERVLRPATDDGAGGGTARGLSDAG